MKKSLLLKYFRAGFLDRAYVNSMGYSQPFSADVRLFVGTKLYEDYVKWKKSSRIIRDYERPKVDGGKCCYVHLGTEKFRKAMRVLPPIFLPIIQAIVLEDREILPPKALSQREKLYFSEDVKRTLCRGLDVLAFLYVRK